jgi:hypothetical protein
METTHTPYKIAKSRHAVPTFSVVFEPSNEYLSHHETEWQARVAIKNYLAADKRRATSK